MDDTIGVRVCQARRAAGLTQFELAARSGVSCATIAKIEQRKIRNPHTDTILRLSDALRVDPSWLSRGHTKKARTNAAVSGGQR